MLQYVHCKADGTEQNVAANLCSHCTYLATSCNKRLQEAGMLVGTVRAGGA